MSKINQIENALKEIEGGKFQKLANAYLHKKGYQNINPLGSVIGTDKTRIGTPDTFIRQQNDKFTFVEFTTEQNNLSKKLNDDLKKCLDVSKTGIPLSEIEEIVFCHNSQLSPEEERELYSECKKHGIKIQVYGIGNISFDLYQKYPGLAQDFLGIGIDTGQILETSDFVENVGRNQLTTPLDTDFHFREKELQLILEELESKNLIILSGSAGVGKSRLALEVLKRFKETHQTFDVRCMYNRGADLFEDIRTHFSQPGEFIILVDDANRITQFDYVVDLIQNQRTDQKIKVIATVRDYARDKINYTAKAIGLATEVELKPMSEKEIKDFISDQYQITNPLFLDRISHIAGGNPRLAIMAARVAVKHNNFDSIRDASILYDEYFSSIANDLKNLQNKDVLKVAGIISFFRAVDRSNEEVMQTIQNTFGISSEKFWECAKLLHNCEVVDIYEEEVVKISDQVFATYLFYLCFFKEKILDFSLLIKSFFPKLNNRLRDSIYPCLNAFDFKKLKNQMRPDIQKMWKELEKDGENLNEFIKLFWFLLQSDTLVHINKKIEAINPESIDFNSIEYETENAEISSYPILDILSLFHQADDESTFRTALELCCKYVEKVPTSAPAFVQLATKRFGFSRFSHHENYIVQKAVVETLWNKSDEGRNDLFTQLFLAVAKKFMPTRYDDTESHQRSITIHQFNLLEVESVFELRRMIWEGLFRLYEIPALQKKIVDIIKNYSNSGYYLSQNKIVEKDSEQLLQFIKSTLDPSDFINCLTVQKYLKMLKRRNIAYDDKIKKDFMNDAYQLYKLLSFDYFDKEEEGLDIKEFEKIKKQKISDYTNKFTLEDYKNFFEKSFEILSITKDSHESYQIKNATIQALVILSENNPSIYPEVIERYLQTGDLLAIQPAVIVDKLIKISGFAEAYRIIEQNTSPTKRQWLFAYYQCLPKEDITTKNLNNLYELYRSAERGETPYDFDYLLKYSDKDSDVIIKVTDIIVEKAKADEFFGHSLDSLFNPLTEANKNILELFKSRQDALENAYMVHVQVDKNADHDGSTLGKILSLNPSFFENYLENLYNHERQSYSYYDNRDYAFLWKHENCDQIVRNTIEGILKHDRTKRYMLENYLERLFCIHGNRSCPPEAIDKQNEFLKSLIVNEAHNLNLMTLLFKPISNFDPERRKSFVDLFLQHNKKFEDFEKLALEPDSWGWSGSAVPMYQGKADYWESLLPLCNSAELLEHKLYIERHVQSYLKMMEAEKKSDFIDDEY